MTARIAIDGAVTALDAKPAPDSVITEDDVKDTAKLAKLLTAMQKTLTEKGREWNPRRLDFDDVPVSSSAAVQLAHHFGGRVRYSVMSLATGGGIAPVLAQSAATDDNTLVLDAYQPVCLFLPSTFTTTSATAQNTALTFPVRSGEKWLVLYWGFAGCSTVNGMKYAIGAPTGSTVDGILDSSLGATTTDARVSITAINTLTSAVHTVAAGERDDFISARLSIAASGSVTIQAASNTAGDTTTIRSYAAVLAFRMNSASSTFAPVKACIRVEEAG